MATANGYATDPEYANKLIKIANQLNERPYRILQPSEDFVLDEQERQTELSRTDR